MSQLGDYDFSFRNPFISDKTIDQLLEEGYIGVPYDFVADQAVFAAICQRFKDKVKWTKTAPDNDGDVGLMTSNVAEFYELTQFMMENFGWYPAYYSNQEVDKPFIFTAKNEIEANAIKVATSGEYGWRGSLYSLDCFGMTRNSRHLCFIFATQPEGSGKQEWLFFRFDRAKNTTCWSVHPTNLKQVCYLWAEEIQVPEPNFNPTADEILNILKPPQNTRPDIVFLDPEGELTEAAQDLILDAFDEDSDLEFDSVLDQWIALKDRYGFPEKARLATLNWLEVYQQMLVEAVPTVS